MKAILDEKIKSAFLTLVLKQINGWCMVHNPEFNVSAWGFDRDEVIKDLHDIIIRKSVINIKKARENLEVPNYLLVYSKKVIKNRDNIENLFKGATKHV
jgi:hypothetical protein